jgi:serine/threonine protein kinase/Tfp pilus assembly protein PilF
LDKHLERTRPTAAADHELTSEIVAPPDSSLTSGSQPKAVRPSDLLGSTDPCPRLPELGDSIFGFTLRRELGRGAFARVFLAEQADLARRPVVLKVSRIEGSEPQTLAQMQHTHIVPVYSLHEDTRAGLRALCMPYFGGASLAQVLDAVRDTTAFPTRGEELVRALDTVAGPELEEGKRGKGEKGKNSLVPSSPFPLFPSSSENPRATLARLSYVRAVAWIVARLAEGLQHAHQRGVLHRDIKPSNILLGADGQPMLLDFNLAQSDFGGQAQASLGGTVAYMSPEHLRALASRDPTQARAVDNRSDIYALGMVLFEMLTGRRPFDHNASYTPLPVLIEAMALERGRSGPSVREVRPDVSWGLESILRRCLEPDPARRYGRAEELAEDLRRLLDDRPLRYAPELSQRERVQKWLRRHPRVTSAGPVCAAAVLLLLGAGVAVAKLSIAATAARSSLVKTEDELEEAQARHTKRAFEAGAKRALFLVNTTNDLEDHLRRGLAVCEDTLGLYGVLDRTDWQEHPHWRRLGQDDRRRLAGDVRELLLLLAGARVRLAPHDWTTLTIALELLDKAAVLDLEPCRALWEDRAAYRRELGDEVGANAARAGAERINPQTARDFYLMAMTRARQGKYSEAIANLNDALRLDPRHYWAWVQRGLCHLERNDPVPALGDFGACIGLQPDFAWGYFNRGYALSRCGRPVEAVADYTSALRCDPKLLAAYLNRGLLRLEVGEAAPALEDFQQVLDRGRDDAVVHSGRGVALEKLGRHAEADVAFATARRRAADGPREVRLRLAWVYGFAVAGRLPDDAWEAFQAVLEEDRENPQALYGCAMLLEARGESAEALRYFDRAIDGDGEFLQARRSRAVLLARTGQCRKAGEEVQKCLAREPNSGATRYAAACVAALTAKDDPSEADRAVELLRQAFELGYGRDKAARDGDLDNIRDHAHFPK